MRSAAQDPTQDAKIIKNIIKLQLILFIAGIAAIKFVEPGILKSVLYGSMVALLNTGFLYWRMRKAESNPCNTANGSLKQVQRAALERFVLIAIMLAVGMSARLGLMPLMLLTGFATGQLIFLLGAALFAPRQSEQN